MNFVKSENVNTTTLTTTPPLNPPHLNESTGSSSSVVAVFRCGLRLAPIVPLLDKKLINKISAIGYILDDAR